LTSRPGSHPASFWLSGSSCGLAQFPHAELKGHSRPRGRMHCNDCTVRAPLLRVAIRPRNSRRDPRTLAGRGRPWRGRSTRLIEKLLTRAGEVPAKPWLLRSGRSRDGPLKRAPKIQASAACFCQRGEWRLRSAGSPDPFAPGRESHLRRSAAWRRSDPPQGVDAFEASFPPKSGRHLHIQRPNPGSRRFSTQRR